MVTIDLLRLTKYALFTGLAVYHSYQTNVGLY